MYLQIDHNGISTSFKPQPDASISLKDLTEHYSKYPERWDIAFKFLIENDLPELPLGRIDLNEEVFINIAEYTTRNLEDSVYESHYKYIDIQYLIKGEELMGVNRNIPKLEITQPYDEEKDYILYKNDENGDMRYANPENYFIFFPADAHMPNVKAKENSLVRKLVVKIKY